MRDFECDVEFVKYHIEIQIDMKLGSNTRFVEVAISYWKYSHGILTILMSIGRGKIVK